MSHGSRGPVIIDTGVFGARLTPRGRWLASAYQPLLEGRPAVISFITVAELRYGAKLAGWGTARLVRLDHELVRVDTAWPGPSLTEAYAAVRTWCTRNGHGLGAKDHEADRPRRQQIRLSVTATPEGRTATVPARKSASEIIDYTRYSEIISSNW